MFLELKKDDKVIYLGNMPYKLANGQEVENHNEELIILSDVVVREQFFKVVETSKAEKKVVMKDKVEIKEKK